MGIEWNEVSAKANGGTEQMARRIEKSLSKDLLNNFQIILSRVQSLDPDKYRIYYVHDLAEDPAANHLAGDGWKNFHRLVFVSNWQAWKFIDRYNIPPSKCVVLQNAIEPIELVNGIQPVGGDQPVRLIYHTTPHRGLNILLAVFDEIYKKRQDVVLDLYSSFNLYGWGDRDEQFKQLFDFADKHPGISNFGSVTNEEVRKALSKAHIFAYPSVWQETSCICLMEAMSAGLICVHPNLGALPETSANWTMMYNWNENQNEHAKVFMNLLEGAIDLVKTGGGIEKSQSQKTYADNFYNWGYRAKFWEAFLQSVLASGESRGLPQAEFVYRV